MEPVAQLCRQTYTNMGEYSIYKYRCVKSTFFRSLSKTYSFLERIKHLQLFVNGTFLGNDSNWKKALFIKTLVVQCALLVKVVVGDFVFP